MIINNLKKVFILTVVLLISLGTIIYIKNLEIKNDLSGSLISDSFIYNFPKADNIIISDNENKIELIKINENWKIKNNFYINENIINSILKDISDNKLVMKTNDITNGNKINIVINNQDKNLYNFTIINNEKNSLIKPNQNNFYWLLSKKIKMPKLKKSEFYKQPLYSFDVKEIRDFSIFNDETNITFSRESYGEKFKFKNEKLDNINAAFFAIFAHKITNLNYTAAINIKSFDYLVLKTQFNITSYDGIVLNVKLYQKDNNHFVTINGKLDRIHKNQAIKQVKEINNKYKNWLFRINSDDAKILNSQILLHQNISSTGE